MVGTPGSIVVRNMPSGGVNTTLPQSVVKRSPDPTRYLPSRSDPVRTRGIFDRRRTDTWLIPPHGDSTFLGLAPSFRRSTTHPVHPHLLKRQVDV